MSSLRTDLRRAAPVLLPARSGLPPGRFASPRMIALVAVTVYYFAGHPSGGPAWAGTGVLMVLTALEPVLGRMQPRAVALHLPGFPPVRRSLASRCLVPFALALLLLLALVAALHGSPWWFVGAAAAQAVVLAAAGAAALHTYAGRAGRARALRAALEAYAPEFVLHTARRGALYQVQMWLPQLEELGRRYAIVSRDEGALPGLASLTGAPVVARVAWRELDDVVVPSLRAALYVNSVAANADFVTYRQLTHVYLGHGESDKALSYHPAHAMYDRIFVSGQAAVERYASNGVVIPAEKFVVVGRPQAASIARADRPVGELAAPTVLYAPTWAGYNDSTTHSSLPLAVALVTALLRRPGAVVFRPHPFSRERAAERARVRAVEALLARDAASTGRRHRYGAQVQREPFSDSANSADAMVADVSSVLVEFLTSDKPMAVVAVGESLERFRERHRVAEGAYVVAADLGNLDQVLADLLERDPLHTIREQVLRHYVGEPDGGSSFRRALTDVLGGPDPRDGGQGG
jgi:hypothetical protein